VVIGIELGLCVDPHHGYQAHLGEDRVDVGPAQSHVVHDRRGTRRMGLRPAQEGQRGLGLVILHVLDADDEPTNRLRDDILYACHNDQRTALITAATRTAPRPDRNGRCQTRRSVGQSAARW
jgi:hypothetical protein